MFLDPEGLRSSNTIGEMLLSSLNKVGGTRSYAREGEGSESRSRRGENREKCWRMNKLATLYKCNSNCGENDDGVNSGCIVVGVRGSLMGIRIANKRN
jgi:hypothetical protein